MIATTIEQSRHLLELELDPKTADMVWVRYAAGGYRLEVLHRELFERIMETDIAAWSLSALLEVIPRDVALYKIEDTYSMHHGWTTDNHTNPIDAGYEIVCWLLRNNLIKKGDNDESKD